MNKAERRVSQLFVPLIFLITSGCGNNPSFSLFGQQHAAPPAGERSHAFVGPCLGAPNDDLRSVPQGAFAAPVAVLAPFFGALASAATKASINAIGNAAAEAGKDKSTSLQGVVSTQPINVNLRALGEMQENSGIPERLCLQIVVGKFSNGDVAPSTAKGLDSYQERLRAIGIPMQEPPRLLVEYVFDFSRRLSGSAEDTRSPAPAAAVRLIETWRVMNGSLSGSGLAPSGRELVINVFFTPLGQDPTKSQQLAIPVERISVPSVRYMDPSRRAAPATQWLSFTEDLQVRPLTVHTLATETRNGNAFLAALGEALKNQEVLNTAGSAASTLAQRSLSSDVRRDARLTAEDTDRSRTDAAFTLYKDAESAISDAQMCVTQCERLNARAKWLASVVQRRFRTLGLPPPPLDLSGLN